MPNTNTECYLSIKFPKDMQLTSESYIYQGYDVMQTDAGNNVLKVSDENVFIQQQAYLSSNEANSNMIVMKGCHFAYQAGSVRFRVTNMYTPDSVKTTEAFEFKMYKNFNQRASSSYPYYSFSNQLLEGSRTIDSSFFISGSLTNGVFTPSLYYIQTDN